MIDIESTGIDNLLDNLSNEEVKNNILYKAVYRGAKVLQGNAKTFFKNAVGEAANHTSKYIKAPFYDGITVKGEKTYIEARVSIMKDFRMKFFEKGTNDRYIKQKGHSDNKRKRKVNFTGKPNYRGRMTATHFFKDAREASENTVNNAIIESISRALERL